MSILHNSSTLLEKTIITSSGYRVMLLHPQDLSLPLLHEIGRGRAISFGAVGEGTGQDMEIDIYDDYYHHLFVYDPKKDRIAGGYRIGFSDQIIDRYGMGGLYINSLYDIHPDFFQKYDKMLELGRAWVAPEYQDSGVVITLLLRGICKVVQENPKYSYWYGVTSLSEKYPPDFCQALIEFLVKEDEISGMLKPKNPFVFSLNDEIKGILSYLKSIKGIGEFDRFIKGHFGFGVPALFKQYSKCNAQFFSPSFDSAFKCLDIFTFFDTKKIEPKYYNYFFLKSNAA